MNLDIKMTTKDGKDLQPVYGPGFTGIENLGNRYLWYNNVFIFLFNESSY